MSVSLTRAMQFCTYWFFSQIDRRLGADAPGNGTTYQSCQMPFNQQGFRWRQTCELEMLYMSNDRSLTKVIEPNFRPQAIKPKSLSLSRIVTSTSGVGYPITHTHSLSLAAKTSTYARHWNLALVSTTSLAALTHAPNWWCLVISKRVKNLYGHIGVIRDYVAFQGTTRISPLI